ncbi:MAG: hypothetical protein IT204_05875 [Fimbriimonadaceae bacterium]|nr:hypothetical protein [Fimbriimonadaceae bacterium]
MATAWLLALALGAPLRWDFGSPPEGLRLPPEAALGGLVAGGQPAVLEVRATAPHHTRVLLPPLGGDGLLRVRVRFTARQGATALYLYSRSGPNGFRFVNWDGQRLGAAHYRGAEQPSQALGSVALNVPDGTWVELALACLGDRLLAKGWPAGEPEPRWGIDGEASGAAAGDWAAGVWTSPRTPSTATVQFDELSWSALAAGDPALPAGPRQYPPLQLAADAQGSFELPALVGLAGPELILALDRHDGALAQLLDRRTGRDWLAGQAGEPLFEVTLTGPPGRVARQLTAADFPDLQIRVGPADLELRYGGLAAPALRPVVRLHRGPDGEPRLRLLLGNASNLAVARVRFPCFTLPAALPGGDPQRDELILPWEDGCLLPQPGSTSQRRQALYPEHASLQFSARCDDLAGLYWAAEDGAGEIKEWQLDIAAGRRVRLTLDHLRPETAGEAGDLPYDCVFRAVPGGWRSAAALYRQWAVNQPFCAPPLAQRADLPAFLTAGSAVLIAGIQNAQGYQPALLGADLEKLPALLATYRQATGLRHLIFVPYGWEQRGTWAGINYLPAVPRNDAWRQAADRLRAQGDRLAFLLSGYWWVLRRQANSNGPAFDDSAQLAQRGGWLVRGPDGQPAAVDAFAEPTGRQSWRGYSVQLCHGSRPAAAYLAEQFAGVAELGVALASFDQEIGGGQRQPCYDPAHGHPPGYGAWMTADFRALCHQIREARRGAGREWGLLIENVSEAAMPELATYWSRQFGEVNVGATGGRGLGLFSYLYHDRVTAIGAACVQGQGTLGRRPDALLRVRILANNLTRGLIPGPFLNDVALEASDPWRRLVSRAFVAFCRPYAPFAEYLLRGRCVPPPELAGESLETWYLDGEQRRTVRLAAVTAGSFATPDGRVGTVLVNASDQPQAVTVTRRGRGAVALCQADGSPAGALPVTGPLRLQLEPLGVRMLLEQPPAAPDA